MAFFAQFPTFEIQLIPLGNHISIFFVFQAADKKFSLEGHKFLLRQ
jgi:hypothetical protein